MLCAQHINFGSSKLEYDDPSDPSNKITMILVIFEETATCTVNTKTGKKGKGKQTDRLC